MARFRMCEVTSGKRISLDGAVSNGDLDQRELWILSLRKVLWSAECLIGKSIKPRWWMRGVSLLILPLSDIPRKFDSRKTSQLEAHAHIMLLLKKTIWGERVCAEANFKTVGFRMCIWRIVTALLSALNSWRWSTYPPSLQNLVAGVFDYHWFCSEKEQLEPTHVINFLLFWTGMFHGKTFRKPQFPLLPKKGTKMRSGLVNEVYWFVSHFIRMFDDVIRQFGFTRILWEGISIFAWSIWRSGRVQCTGLAAL